MKLTRKCIFAAGLSLLFSVAYVYGTDIKAEYKTFRLNPTDVAITCKNGNNPVTKALDPSVIVVSCK